jgi:hypothetical protein
MTEAADIGEDPCLSVSYLNMIKYPGAGGGIENGSFYNPLSRIK